MELDLETCAAQAGVTPDYLLELTQKASLGYNQLTPQETAILRKAKPAQVRPCGACTMCCIAPSIDASTLLPADKYQPKPACTVCSCVSSVGCSRYDNRPAICEDYQCMWSMGLVPEEYSPLAIGVAWVIQNCEIPGNEDKILVVGHTIDTKAACNNPDVRNCVANFSTREIIAAVTIRDDKHLVSFSKKFGVSTAEIDPSDPMKMAILESSIREIF